MSGDDELTDAVRAAALELWRPIEPVIVAVARWLSRWLQ